MKKSLILKTLLGLAVSAFSASVANAQATISDSVGDVTLGFYASGGTGSDKSVMINLGPISTFLDATAPISLTGINGLADADLAATYGANWATDGLVNWGVIAGNSTTAIPGAVGNYNVWISQPELPAGTPASEIVGQTKNTLAAVSNDAETFNILLNGQTSTTNSNVTAVIENNATSDNSWFNLTTTNGTDPLHSFGRLPGLNQVVTADTISDLEYIVPPTSGGPLATGKAAVTIGKFEFTTDTTLVYTPSTVPEPSSIGLTGVGFLSLIGFVALRRRRSAVA